MNQFDSTYALELFSIAEQDLESARVLFENWQRGRKENIFFMVQQSVEKALKAYLCRRDGTFPMVHDLGILLGKMDQLPPKGYDLVTFSQFAGIRRRESGKMTLDQEDALIAINIAQDVLNWVKSKI